MATLTLAQNKFQGQLLAHLNSNDELRARIAALDSVIERQQEVIRAASRLALPPDTDDQVLKLISSIVVARLGTNPIVDAANGMRDEEREKRRQSAAAKKGKDASAPTGDLPDDEQAADATRAVTPADTTKTALRDNGKGVHWVPEDALARASRVVPGTETAVKIPVADSAFGADPSPDPAADAEERPTVTPWQELDEVPATDSGAHAKEALPGDKNPNNAEQATPAAKDVMDDMDPFAAAISTAMQVDEGQNATAEKKADADVTPVVAARQTPTGVADTDMGDDEGHDAPANDPAKGQGESTDSKSNEEVATCAPTEDHEEAKRQSPSDADESPQNAAPSTPIVPTAEEDDDEDDPPFPGAFQLLILTMAFGNAVANADNKIRGNLELIWNGVLRVVSKLEEHAFDANEWNFGIAPPVTDYYHNKPENVAWFIHKLNAIGMLTCEDALKAADETKASGMPTTLLDKYQKLSRASKEHYLKRIGDKITEYLCAKTWMNKTSNAARNDVFPAPTSHNDFVPEEWRTRFLDEKQCELWDTNEIRIRMNLPIFKTFEEMRADPTAAELLRQELEEREESADEDYVKEDEEDDEEDDEDTGSFEDIADKSARVTKSESTKPRANPKKRDANAAAKQAPKVSGSARRKGSAPKRVPQPTDLVADATPPPSSPMPKAREKRASSPLPEMPVKLRFVAETVCPDYDEIREAAQNGKPKSRKELADAVAQADKAPQKKQRKNRDAPEVGDEVTANEKKRARTANDVEEAEHKLRQHMDRIIDTLPAKLKKNFTLANLTDDLARYSGENHTFTHKSVERVAKDAADLSRYLVNALCDRIFSQAACERLRTTLTSVKMVSWTHESAAVPNVCSLSGTVIEERSKLCFFHKDEDTLMDDAFRVHAQYAPLLIAINYLHTFKTKDFRGLGRQEVMDAASTFVMAMGLAILAQAGDASK